LIYQYGHIYACENRKKRNEQYVKQYRDKQPFYAEKPAYKPVDYVLQGIENIDKDKRQQQQRR
jgi:hypothetical protein